MNFFKFSVRQLGIRPQDFWKMTPREFWALYYDVMGGERTDEPMTRAALEEMKRTF